MALRAELEARESDCSTAPEYIALAMEAAAEPKDLEYAAELLETAEDECFDALEYAQLGNAYAVALGDKDKARELLEQAAKDAKKIPEFMQISKYAAEGLADKEFAQSILAKVESQCKTADDYFKLAETLIKEQKDTDTAKAFVKKAEKKIDGIDETCAFAAKVSALFADKKWVEELLESVEDDAQFTKDCLKLAEAFKNYCGDDEKASELMNSAKDFAMKGEEHIELAKVYWNLFGDKAKSAASFEKGLADVSDKISLMNYAKQIAVDMGNSELAKKFYARAESKMTSAKDLNALAQAVIDDISDKTYAAEIYARMETSLEDPKELALLAADVLKNLEDKQRAKAIYEKALGLIVKFPPLIELLDESFGKLADKDFAKVILEKAEKTCSGTPELLITAGKVAAVLADKDFARRLLEAAEEQVTSLPEMKEVVKAVKENYKEDADWMKRVEEKLQKREANQSIYEEFQKRENSAGSLKEYLLLIDEMMASLDDKYYAVKLFNSAERLLDSEFFNFDKYRKLIMSILRHLNDAKRTSGLLDRLSEQRAKFFFDLCAICHCAVDDLPDKKLGKSLADKYLKNYEENLDKSDKKCVYSYTNLATSVFKILGDSNWALGILDKATTLDSAPLAKAYISYLAGKFGDELRSDRIAMQAAEGCSGALEFYNLTLRLKSLKFDTAALKKVYSVAAQRLQTLEDKLMWAEGVVDIFGDRDWALSAYSQIESGFSSPTNKAMYEDSRRRKIEQKYFC